MNRNERVKEIRNQLGLTKFKMACALNLSIDLIISMENGRRNVTQVTWEKYQGYARTKGVKVENYKDVE